VPLSAPSDAGGPRGLAPALLQREESSAKTPVLVIGAVGFELTAPCSQSGSQPVPCASSASQVRVGIGTMADAVSPASPRLAAFGKARAPTEPPRSGTALTALRGGARDLLSVREVAMQLGVSTATVYKLCDRGDLPHLRVLNSIRVTPSALAAFIAESQLPDNCGRDPP
jgi:excisionase family DNA binding protein